VGQRESIDLPDGSVIRVNTDSVVEIRFDSTARRVQLVHGEAHFKVAKDRSRPFVVRVGKIDVRTVGTAFSIRKDPERVEVLVTEGRVRVNDSTSGTTLLPQVAASALVSAPPQEPLLTAGNRFVIAVGAAPEETGPVPAVAPVPPAEISRALAWQEGRLEFDSSPLEQVVSEFNRYNSHKLVLADPRLRDLKFGGKFQATGYDALVRLLETSFHIRAERGGNETRLYLGSSEDQPIR
jgi:transmembrane sensor